MRNWVFAKANCKYFFTILISNSVESQRKYTLFIFFGRECRVKEICLSWLHNLGSIPDAYALPFNSCFYGIFT